MLHSLSPFALSPALLLNALALFLALAGSWLLLATRLRERRALARLAGEGQLTEEEALMDEATERVNRFFYRFAGGTLLTALLVSWTSTQF